jgi:hypothetical protein
MYDIIGTYQRCRMGYPSKPEKYTGGVINVSSYFPIERECWYFNENF